MESFFIDEQYLQIDSLVEVISAVSHDNTIMVKDILEKLQISIQEFHIKYGTGDLDFFDSITWVKGASEDKKLWMPLLQNLEKGPRSTQELDILKRSIIAERRTEDQTIAVRTFDRFERRFVALHYALISAVTGSSISSGGLKTEALKTIIEGYTVVSHVALIYAPIIAKSHAYIWNGLVFTNDLDFKPEDDERDRVFQVMLGVVRAVRKVAVARIGSRKIAEVFRKIITDKVFVGFQRHLGYACLIRSKPRAWPDIAQSIIANTDKDAYYLLATVEATKEQFFEEVNTFKDREELKKLIAHAKTKRELRRNNPSSGLIESAVKQLEEQGVFQSPETKA